MPIWKSSLLMPQLSEPTSIQQTHQKNSNDQAIGRSRGGLTTKIHACVDALGNPIRLILTAGQMDVTQGAAMVAEITTEAVTAERAQTAMNSSKPFKAVTPKPTSRRIATRYNKLANRFNAFLHLACAYISIL
jgi:transposase